MTGSCVIYREKMMLTEDPRMQPVPKKFASAFAPFPRSTWIHPHVPYDNFDRVCKNIWSKAKECKEGLGRGQSPAETRQNKEGTPPDSEPSHRAEERQKETDDLGLSTKYEEFTLPCPYLSGRRHPHVAKPARVLSPVMEVEMKLNEEEAERKRNVDEGVEDKQRIAENTLNQIRVHQSISRTDKQRSPSEPGPVATNPICSAAEGSTHHLQEGEDPPLPSRDICKSEDEQDIISSSDSSSSDDDFVTLPGVRSLCTDSSDDDSASNSSDCEVQENEIQHSSDELSSDSEQDSPSPGKEDFPPLSTIRAGALPRLMEIPVSSKVRGQWEIPLSFHPHDIPAATLASGITAPAQAPVQGAAEAPHANSKTNAPSAASTRQDAYDLLADFPALERPKKPLELFAVHDGNPKTKDAKGLTHPPNHHQGNGASRQRRMENMTHEVSSICAGDQKSPTISCEELKANNQASPRVAVTDGVGVNARSWASAAKAGMKQAAAPQEKARPCTLQQIVTINGAKARYSATQNFTNKVIPCHQVINPLMTPVYRVPQPHNPNRFVRPGYPPSHQHFGAPAHRANCPPGFRCSRFPFQQARGNPSKHIHM